MSTTLQPTRASNARTSDPPAICGFDGLYPSRFSLVVTSARAFLKADWKSDDGPQRQPRYRPSELGSRRMSMRCPRFQ
jgi:hypothetical protein